MKFTKPLFILLLAVSFTGLAAAFSNNQALVVQVSYRNPLSVNMNDNSISYSTQSRNNVGPAIQTIRVNSGATAHITQETSSQVVNNVSTNQFGDETVGLTQQTVTTGFDITPTLIGNDQVTVVIQQSQGNGQDTASVTQQSIATTTTLMLNQWVNLLGQTSEQQNSINYATGPRGNQIPQALYIRVSLPDQN